MYILLGESMAKWNFASIIVFSDAVTVPLVEKELVSVLI